MPLEAVITQEQRDSFSISKFIFHIIELDAKDEPEVIYLDEVELLPKQNQFFLDRLKDVAEGTQYVFKSETGNLRDKCNKIIDDPEKFIEYSKNITEDFAGRHNKTMSPGVFVVAVIDYLLAPHDWQKMIFLVKMDGQPSFSYSYKKVGDRKIAKVSEVPNSLNETKKAIQKSALIDVSENHAWHALAFDKHNASLTDYFKNFLGVTERYQDSVLTRTAHTIVRNWAKALPFEKLPQGEDFQTYAARALNYLKDNDLFVIETFIQTVVRDSDPDRKKEFSALLLESLASAGVAGQTFHPRPDSLPKRQRKTAYETNEGVLIEWEGEKDAVGVSITELPNNMKRITIDTRKLTPKG